MIACVVCAELGRVAKAEILVPHHQARAHNGLVAWVPICTEHLHNWFMETPREHRLTVYVINEDDHQRHHTDPQELPRHGGDQQA